MSKFHMRIERLEKRASEKEPVARPSSNKGVSLKNQKRAELLRRRIEELDRLLAMLNSENEKSSARWKSRSPGFVAWTTPKLWQRLPR
jgi:hypothetical protein